VKIAIGSDHAGFELKESLKRWLVEHGHEVDDCGTHSAERADYPKFGQAVARKVAGESADFGILVCGSGQGMAMTANKVKGVRAAVIRTQLDAQMARLHNDANVACFGERMSTPEDATEALTMFLATAFEGGRHEARVEQMEQIDNGAILD
jgi:ribose 5-phosphate isomerase B